MSRIPCACRFDSMERRLLLAAATDGDGNDQLEGGIGIDVLNGGKGTDSADGDSANLPSSVETLP